MYKYSYLLCLATLLITLNAQFSVYMPQCAIEKVITRYMNYTLANFGHIPYGSSLIGQMIIPSDEKYCSVNETETFRTKNDDIKKFMLIKRGDCKFTKKIINAQKKGIALVIVYDNQQSSQPNVIMVNDGFGHLVDIPAIFISYFDGLALEKAYKECNTVILSMKFDVFTSNVANLTLWLDSSNRETYITIRDFYQNYFKPTKQKINLSINFKISQLCQNYKCKESDCLGSEGKYCFISDQKIGENERTGVSIIEEHLRSYYILDYVRKNKMVDDVWWKYMIAFDDFMCIDQLDMKSCSQRALGKAIPAGKIIFSQIVAKVEMAKGKAVSGQANPLQDFSDAAYNNDILFYPEATINDRNYYGLFKAGDIFNMICQSLNKPPAQCHSFYKKSGKTVLDYDNDSMWKIIMSIVIAMLFIFILAIYIYNRLIRKQINQKMSTQVNQMVEHYISMTQSKSKSQMGL